MVASTSVSLDTETNITKYTSDRYPIGFSVYTDTGYSAYCPVAHSEFAAGIPVGNVSLEGFSDLLEGCRGKVVVFHNAKFDLHQLSQLFDISPLLDPSTQLFCTMNMGHIINENDEVALDKMAKKYLGDRKFMDLSKAMKSMWEATPPYVMAKYAEVDTKLTLDLYFALLPFFEKYQEYWKIEREFLKLLYKMESNGLPVDLPFCRQQMSACFVRMQEIQDELGFDPAKPSQLHKKFFDAPPIGLGLEPSLFTPGGKPQVNEAYLETVSHPIAGLVLEFRGLAKAKTSYFQAYLDASDKNGRLHADFKQHQTVTGRLSCANPNLQQIPRDGNVKQSFNPEIGCELWELDYSNIEYRLAAVYSRDPDLIGRFERGEDFHQMVADRMGVTRQRAKTINFLTIFGGGEQALSKQLKIPSKDARRILGDYWKQMPALRKVIDQAATAGKQNGEVKLWSGRFRHFEYSSEARKSFNSIVQGGAFEIMKRSMLKLNEAGFDIRNQVHDSVWLMIPTGEVSTAVPVAKSIMSDWTKEAFGLTFSVDAKRLK